jgi:hypothetical protein
MKGHENLGQATGNFSKGSALNHGVSYMAIGFKLKGWGKNIRGAGAKATYIAVLLRAGWGINQKK